jgi:hypothetical protein
VEQLFVEAGEPARERALPPAGPPAVGKLLTLTGRYHVEIVGPPPGPA